MLGGYSEVSQYLMDEDGISNLEYERLPEEYIPKFPVPDPWHRLTTCPDDFLMIAEFSEQEGPKPLLTIPDDLSSRIDLNDFSVKIMSVDFQTPASDKFSISEDTQVVISLTQHAIYAYIHHFTLYDSQARGFVRPFCMTYVTPDKSKLMSLYEDLHSEFRLVSRYFRYGNLALFVGDMTHYLTDLQFTKERLLEQQFELECNENSNDVGHKRQSSLGLEEELILKSVSMSGLEAAIKEVKYILDTTTSMLNDTEMSMKFEKLKLKSQGEAVSPEDERLQFDRFHYSASFSELSPMTENVGKRRTGSCSELSNHSNHSSDWDTTQHIYRPKLVRTINKRRFDKFLRNLDELCQHGAEEGKRRLHTIYKYFSRDMATLLIERNDAQLMDPACGLLSIGRNVEVNFLYGLQLDGGPLSGMKNSESVLSGRWDDSCSFKSAESFLSCQDDFTCPENQSLGSYDIISNDDSVGEFLQTKDLADAPDMMKSTISGSSAMTDSTKSNTEKTMLFSSVDHLHCLAPGLPGYGIKKLLHEFAFSPHLLYAILCGRLVAVVGSSKSEKQIRCVVTALSMFVAGHNSTSIIKWMTSPLLLSHLGNIKLVGLCCPDKRPLDQFIPTPIRRHITLFDLERRVLLTPGYQGGIVTDICNKQKCFSSNIAYVAYIHSILMELSSKAFIYFHAFCLKQPTTEFRNKINHEAFRRKQQEFFTRLKIGSDDSVILEYLTEVLIQQQIQEFCVNVDNPDLLGKSINLSARKSTVFKT